MISINAGLAKIILNAIKNSLTEIVLTDIDDKELVKFPLPEFGAVSSGTSFSTISTTNEVEGVILDRGFAVKFKATGVAAIMAGTVGIEGSDITVSTQRIENESSIKLKRWRIGQSHG